MKKLTCLIAALSLGTTLWAMPSQITVQGTLRQKSLPVNGTRNMQFSFVDSSGSNIPNTSPIAISNVQVTNGLFAVQVPIDPTIPWEQYTPYIQISVEGQILSPNQPINANLYAVAAIPQGMVAMFAGNCPATGWTRFSALDNAFAMGGATYGATGGKATHTHTLGAPTTTATGVVFGSAQGSGSTWSDWSRANHVHSVSTESNLPPYVTMVFCQKQ